MKRGEMRLATITGPSGNYHYHLTDETGQWHAIIQGQFDPGAKTATGSRVTIEHRPPIGWYVLGKRKPRDKDVPQVRESSITQPVRNSNGKYVYPPGMTSEEKRKFRAESRKAK